MRTKTVPPGKVLFSPGKVLISTPAIEACERNRRLPREFLDRHIRGDWGEACNMPAANCGGQAWCMSKYWLSDQDDQLWIITSDDHSTTVMMVPGEIDLAVEHQRLQRAERSW
jgi:hypothetical protein